MRSCSISVGCYEHALIRRRLHSKHPALDLRCARRSPVCAEVLGAACPDMPDFEFCVGEASSPPARGCLVRGRLRQRYGGQREEMVVLYRDAKCEIRELK
jgi:hypothetical protein